MILDALAQRYHTRPSALLRGNWLDYQVDVAVALIAIEEDERRPKDASHNTPARPSGKQRVRSRPSAPVSRPANSQGFAEPETLAAYGQTIRSMPIPEDGIW